MSPQFSFAVKLRKLHGTRVIRCGSVIFFVIGFANFWSTGILRLSLDEGEPWNLPHLVKTTPSALDSAIKVSLITPDSDLDTYIELRSKAREALHVEETSSPSAAGFSHRHVDKPRRAHPLTIAQYSHVYGPSELWMDKPGNYWAQCRQPCQAVADYANATAAASADVVIFSLQDFNEAPWRRSPSQLWVGTYFESPAHFPALTDENIVAQFNLTMGFRPNADMPVFNMVYDTFKDFDRLRNYPLPDWNTKHSNDTPMMSVWISNCGIDKTGRLAILEKLAAQGITYASYGACRRTHEAGTALSKLQSDEWRRYAGESAGAELVAVAVNHLFFYAAENSVYPYYITEKVFHGLLAGSVPIYVGDALHLKMIVPPRSIIYAEDYASVELLAAHVSNVAHDPVLYQSYLKWRSDPQAVKQLERVMALPQWATAHPKGYACALCELLHSYIPVDEA